MKVLVSNDDGIEAPGILALARACEKLGEVTVVAPERERSTAGHSLTLHKPLRILEVAPRQYATSGSPADCIYLSTRFLLSEPPDLVVSGINRGANLGTDVHYSGTVAAAREAALMNLKSYAFSLVDIAQIRPGHQPEPFRYEVAAGLALEVIARTETMEFPAHTFLNVNIPNLPREEIRGIKVVRQGFRYYSGDVTERADPRGKRYYWIGGGYLGFEPGLECDCVAVGDGFVSVTPLTIDCTHNDFYTTLKGRF